MYAQDDSTRFLEITYRDGSRETLWFSDFTSGAVIRNVVDRAKKMAIKDLLTDQVRGLSQEHLRRAVAEEFLEQQDLPDTSDPEEWARISGRRKDTIADLRFVLHRGSRAAAASAPTDGAGEQS